MKKAFNYFLIVCFIFGFVSCASQKATSTTQEEVKLKPINKIRTKDSQSFDANSSTNNTNKKTIKKERPKEHIKFKPKE